MHRGLSGTGLGLMVVSLFVTLLLSTVDPLWAERHVTLLALCVWVQQAALVLGAALLAAGQILLRLAPAAVASRNGRPDAPVDWYA